MAVDLRRTKGGCSQGPKYIASGRRGFPAAFPPPDESDCSSGAIRSAFSSPVFSARSVDPPRSRPHIPNVTCEPSPIDSNTRQLSKVSTCSPPSARTRWVTERIASGEAKSSEEITGSNQCLRRRRSMRPKDPKKKRERTRFCR